jgi:hypothetical protein
LLISEKTILKPLLVFSAHCKTSHALWTHWWCFGWSAPRAKTPRKTILIPTK